MPAPTDVEDIKGVNPETEEQETRPSSDDAPFAAVSYTHLSVLEDDNSGAEAPAASDEVDF